jgi:glycosyltransferase involved in cell wall biosynthesis
VGVAVPTRNSAATLRSTLLSLLSQRDVAVSIVVADSESTDGTLEVCRQWNVRTMDVPPGNMYRAINAALRAMAAPWLTYLNSDDLAYSDAYARLVREGEARGADVVYGHADFVDETGCFLYTRAALGPTFARRQLRAGTMPFVQPAAAFRREVFERLCGFDERFRHVADYDFFARAAACGFRFARVGGTPLAAFRVHGRQLSTVNKGVVDEEQRARRRECGRYAWVSRRGLSTVWKARNAGNYLAALVNRP